LRTTSSIEDQDTLLIFFKRLLLSIILLDLTVDHLIESATVGGNKGAVCSPEFENVMAVRFVFSGTSVTWKPAAELRSMIKLLNLYIKVHVFTLVCSCDSRKSLLYSGVPLSSWFDFSGSNTIGHQTMSTALTSH
jgi:hypothetical protein